MRRADDTAKRASALIEKAGKALTAETPDAELLASMAQLVAETTTDQAEVRRNQEHNLRTIKDLHGLLRDIRRFHSRGMDPQMLARIDTAVPDNVTQLHRVTQLWAVYDQTDNSYHPMRDKRSAELFAEVANSIAEIEGREPMARVVPSIWPEVQHWRTIAEREYAENSEAQKLAFSAMQQVDTLNEQVDQLRAGLDVPTRPVRGVSIYTDHCDGGRFVLLGAAAGAGEFKGVTVVAYRDARNGALHFRSTAEFDECMILEARQR